jgi:hypothetical protein
VWRASRWLVNGMQGVRGSSLGPRVVLLATPTAPTRWMTGLVDLEHGRLLDLVANPHQGRRGRLASGPAARLAGQVGTAALDPKARVRQRADRAARPCDRGGDHFHTIRLANAVTDQARRQVEQVPLGRRGRTYDPPYCIRKLLVTAAEQLTERGRARLWARDTMKIDAGPTSRRISIAPGGLCRGAASRYRTTGRCGPAAHRPRPSSRTLQVPPRDATDVTGVAPAGRRAPHQTHERGGGSLPVLVTGRGSSTDSSSSALRSEGARGGSLRSCRTTPLATCRWPG